MVINSCMKTSSYNLLPSTTFGSAVGNYDGTATTFSGVPQKGASYYSKDKGVQTLSWYLTGAVCILVIEATLDEDNTTTNYFPIQTIGDGIAALNGNAFANLTGNYTWVRVTLTDFSAGTINKVSIGY